jgi:hypothetical protein
LLACFHFYFLFWFILTCFSSSSFASFPPLPFFYSLPFPGSIKTKKAEEDATFNLIKDGTFFPLFCLTNPPHVTFYTVLFLFSNFLQLQNSNICQFGGASAWKMMRLLAAPAPQHWLTMLWNLIGWCCTSSTLWQTSLPRPSDPLLSS